MVLLCPCTNYTLVYINSILKFIYFELNWVIPKTVAELLSMFGRKSSVNKMALKYGSSSKFVVVHSWEKDVAYFQGREISIDKLKSLFLRTLYHISTLF